MRERINRLAKGIVDTETPLLVFQTTAIEERVREGELTRKEIFVTSENGLNIKGLVYSSNARVTIPNHAFGGLRNHVSFEVNSTYLEHGDEIKGSFYLVTNGGEREIPYSFHVETGESGRILGQLKTARDFAEIACRDYNLALRLFEYQDFAEVPFMQDLHIRAVYDGLRGMGNRHIQMEEFLIATGGKSPVRIVVDRCQRVCEDPETITSDVIDIRKEGWGYLPISVKTDGNFLKLTVKKISEDDFKDHICHLEYQILPDRLHGGNNYGAVIVSTMTETLTVPVLVIRRRNSGGTGLTGNRNRYGRYLMLRLEYESQMHGRALLINQMLEETDQLEMTGGRDDWFSLIMAELYMLAGKREQAMSLVEQCRDQVQQERIKRPDLYCLLQYIQVSIWQDEVKRASIIRLLRKYMVEGEADYLRFYLLTQLDETMKDNPGELLMQMKELYLQGCHSPFLYQQAARLLNQMPELLYRIGSFEVQVLHFAAQKELLSETMSWKVAKLAANAKYYNRLYCMLLMRLYKTYPCRQLLEAVCSMLIKGERRGKEDFVWYDRALKENISITRLYEYYLYSIPADFNHLIPKEILLYFSYAYELDRHSKSVLYQNILTYMRQDDSLYREFERDMEKFATERIFESRIDSHMAVIYDHMIYKDMIDLPIARILPGILKTYRIRCDHKDMKYAIICYEELVEEGIYPLRDGIAYAPLFSDYVQIMFQDAYGNRHTDIGFIKVPVMDKPELEEKCFEVYPEHPMLLLKASREVKEKELLEEPDVLLMEKALTQLKLHPLYKKVLTARIIDFYQSRLNEQEETEISMDSLYLLAIDKRMLTRQQRSSICETLIQQNYIREAFEMVREYGFDEISPKRRQKLCARMISERLFDQDELLLELSYRSFEDKLADSVILDYLCEYFNGTTEQMYQILKQGIACHVETYDLEERLLAQMLFSDQTARADRVFALYMEKKRTSDSIVKAYFTMKSSEYVLRDIPADDRVFAYLEGMVNGAMEKDKLSTIYLLALTKYYATLPVLEEEQKVLCQMMVDILLKEGMVFPYFKSLADHVTMPDDVTDKGIIQYIGHKDSRVDLQIRILPDESQYHSEDMKRVYQGIFLKQKVLFEGEVLEYQVYERKGEQKLLMEEGRIVCDLVSSKEKDSRFGCLNQMGLCLRLKEDEGLKRRMKEYLMKTVTIETLFDLM